MAFSYIGNGQGSFFVNNSNAPSERDTLLYGFSLIYTDNSRGRIAFLGGEKPFYEKSLILISENTEYNLIFDSEDSEISEVFFTRDFISGELLSSLKQFAPFPVVISSERLSVEIFSIIERLSSDTVKNDEIYLRLLIKELLLLIGDTYTVSREKKSEALCKRVEKYLSENLDKNVDLDSLARHFFVSKYYLCRAFKSYTGITLHSYVTSKRLLFSKKLIESGEAASDVAYKVGFGDYSAFYRAYVKLFGVSPTKKRRKEE